MHQLAFPFAEDQPLRPPRGTLWRKELGLVTKFLADQRSRDLSALCDATYRERRVIEGRITELQGQLVNLRDRLRDLENHTRPYRHRQRRFMEEKVIGKTSRQPRVADNVPYVPRSLDAAFGILAALRSALPAPDADTLLSIGNRARAIRLCFVNLDHVRNEARDIELLATDRLKRIEAKP